MPSRFSTPGVVPRRARTGRTTLTAFAALLMSLTMSSAAPAAPSGDHVVLSWNDLGMHCMNRNFGGIVVLPPYNNLNAQVIHRGSATALPSLLTSGVTVEYSIPGNTYSVGKTDFWNYTQPLFGVTLPPDIGLAGKGLAGTLDPVATHFHAEGIPVTPYTDAMPQVESPFQKALVIARGTGGVELARSTPVIPVSAEIGCVAAGCHSSETAIINSHPREGGFNPLQRPILCASCHASPALGTPGNPEAGYLSMRLHDQHQFMDETMSGTALCYRCHPGVQAECLRGVMNDQYGMVCQDCHGTMRNVARTIEQGRVPWANEPACRTCHTSQFGEPVGQLFRNSTGHGGVYCSACHGSPHAEFPSREANDNANMVALQGHAGVLDDCTVCHGVTPAGAGPHGIIRSDVAEVEIMGGTSALAVAPNPTRGACTISFRGPIDPADGRLLVFDAQGRTIAMLRPERDGSGGLTASWDGRRTGGADVAPGVYFVKWQGAGRDAAARVLVAR